MTIDGLASELQYDFLIRQMIDDVLPEMTYGQVDALLFACQVELEERKYAAQTKDDEQ